MVWQVKHLLAEHHIPCFIKNEYAIGAMGELSPLDALPEVWLTDDEWLPQANKLIAELLGSKVQKRDWYCATCHEHNDGSFEVCWQCGHPSPSENN